MMMMIKSIAVCQILLLFSAVSVLATEPVRVKEGRWRESGNFIVQADAGSSGTLWTIYKIRKGPGRIVEPDCLLDEPGIPETSKNEAHAGPDSKDARGCKVKGADFKINMQAVADAKAKPSGAEWLHANPAPQTAQTAPTGQIANWPQGETPMKKYWEQTKNLFKYSLWKRRCLGLCGPTVEKCTSADELGGEHGDVQTTKPLEDGQTVEAWEGNRCGYKNFNKMWEDLVKLKWAITPTAGMRELGQSMAAIQHLKEAMEKTETVLTGTTWTYDESKKLNVLANVLTGAMEGLFGFDANIKSMGVDGVDEKKTIYVEQGGSSLQIAFRVPCDDMMRGTATLPPSAAPAGRRRLLTRLKKQIIDSSSSSSSSGQPALQPMGTDDDDGSTPVFLQSEAFGYIKRSETLKGCVFSTSFMGYGQDSLFGLLFNADKAAPCMSAKMTITQTLNAVQPRLNVYAKSKDLGTTSPKKVTYTCEKPDCLSGKADPTASNFPWMRQVAFIGDRQNKFPEVKRKIDAQELAAEESCKDKLLRCKAAIVSVTKEMKEMRYSEAVGVGTNKKDQWKGLPFGDRWKRIEAALSRIAAHPKATDYAKTKILFGGNSLKYYGCNQFPRIPISGDHLSDNCLEVRVRENPKKNTATKKNQGDFCTPAWEVENHAFKPMYAAMGLYLRDKLSTLVSKDGPALPFTALTEIGEWTDSMVKILFKEGQKVGYKDGQSKDNPDSGLAFNYWDAENEPEKTHIIMKAPATVQGAGQAATVQGAGQAATNSRRTIVPA